MIEIIRVNPKLYGILKMRLWIIEQEIFKEEAFEDIESLDTFLNKNAYNYIVLDNTRIVGYLMSAPLIDSSEHLEMKDRKNYFYLESIGLLPKYQKIGLGYKLIDKFLIASKKKHLVPLLDATSEGMVRLALKKGFKKVRFNAKHTKNGAWIMVKK